MEISKQRSSLAAPWPQQRWTTRDARRVLAAWKASGLTLSAFARRRGLQVQRLSWWKRRLEGAPHHANTSASSTTPPAPFIPLTVCAAEAEAPAAMVELVDGGLRIELRALEAASVTWLAALVRALGEAP